MEKMQNLYEVRKSLRFALTKPNKKENHKMKTHLEFNDLVKLSFNRISDSIDSNESGILKNEKLFIYKIVEYIELLEIQLNFWKKIYERYDVISLDKDFYKTIARKSTFSITKKVTSREVNLSSLSFENREKLLNYWKINISKSLYLLKILKPKLNQYKNSVDNPNTLSHKKPNLIDFRKTFLSILNSNKEWLIPIFNNSLLFDVGNKSEKQSNNKLIKEFSSNKNKGKINSLILSGKKIKEYFELNGGQVPFAKVSFNYYTAVQKPNEFKTEINTIIGNLKLEKLINNLKNKTNEEVKEHFEFQREDKINLLKDYNKNNNSYLELAQLFKTKAIPFSIKSYLAKYFSKDSEEEYNKILNILDLIGNPVDIGNDYKNTTDKETFSLNKYPLKIAFDYSWENLARNLKNKVDFPEKQCLEFLENNFNFNINNSDFILYSNLLFISENLATIEYNEPSLEKEEEIIKNIKNTFNEINFKEGALKGNKKDKDSILELLEKNDRDYKNILKAKKNLGQKRGGLKNKNEIYYKMTTSFKEIASFLGRNFADLRDKTREENELNKISHYGIIIEDKNEDKYILALELDGKDTRDILEDKLIDNGDYKILKVNSFTSKALNKIVKNPGGYKDFHNYEKNSFYDYGKYTPKKIFEYKNGEKVKNDKGNNIYKKNFLIYIKKCLISSEMAKNQNWSKFNWNFENCNTYEEIEREIDTKGYELKEKSISKLDLEDLINNKKCSLFPLINQDISSKKIINKNNSTLDFENAYNKKNGYRLHPEFNIFYRTPTDEHKKENNSKIINRFGRLQLIANLLIEYIPQNTNYINKKEQNKISGDEKNQNKLVDNFNKNKVNPYFEKLENYYIFGIDRGIKQLATLCITNNFGVIQNYDIYTKIFNSETKKWDYSFVENKGILDLTNLKIESDFEGNKYLIDLSTVRVFARNEEGEKIEENGNFKMVESKQNIKLKQLAYIRKLQFQMSENKEGVLNFIEKYKNKGEGNFIKLEKLKYNDCKSKEGCENIRELITPYKEGKYYSDLPKEVFQEMFRNYYILKTDSSLSDIEKNNLFRLTEELDASDELKRGVVANMIGVITFLLKKYDYKVKISLENLNQSFGGGKDGLDNNYIPINTNFKEQENKVLAGLGIYHFFEEQLLKKIFKISIEEGILHLVPSFESVKNYNKLNFQKDKVHWVQNESYRKFGIIYFVRPHNTSKRCPICLEAKELTRNYNIFKCKKCEFETGEDNSIIIKKYKKEKLNIDLIKNGDDNGAYNIGEKIQNLK